MMPDSKVQKKDDFGQHMRLEGFSFSPLKCLDKIRSANHNLENKGDAAHAHGKFAIDDVDLKEINSYVNLGQELYVYLGPENAQRRAAGGINFMVSSMPSKHQARGLSPPLHFCGVESNNVRERNVTTDEGGGKHLL